MKEHAIKKINSMGKAGKIIMNILRAFVIFAFICTFGATIYAAILPEDIFRYKAAKTSSISIDVSKINQHLTDEDRAMINSGEFMKNGNFSVSTQNSEVQFEKMTADGDVITLSTTSPDSDKQISAKDGLLLFISVDIMLVLIIISLSFGGSLCKAINNCTSPFEENVINKMRNFAYSLIPWVLLNDILRSIFLSIEKTGHARIMLTLDIDTLLVVLALLALVYIFKYGAILQQESDETL